MEINNILPYAQISRQHGISGKKIYNTSKKLASGYKILQASDGSAALSISEKMRAQIRGLDQGVQNAQDAYSLCQTIDGKAQSCHALLQRIRELTLQAANGTNTDQDRGMIQQEVEQSIQELTQISNSLLDGSNIDVIKRCILEKEDIQDILRRYDFPEITSPLYYSPGSKELSKKTAEILMGLCGIVQFRDDILKKVTHLPDDETIFTEELRKDAVSGAYQLLETAKCTTGYGDTLTAQDWNDIMAAVTYCSNNSVDQWGDALKYLNEIRLQTPSPIGRIITLARAALKCVYDAGWAKDHNKTESDIRGACKNYIDHWVETTMFSGTTSSILVTLGYRWELRDTQLLKDFKEKKIENVYRGIQFMLDGRNYDGSLRDPIRYEMYVQVGANAGHAIKLTFSHLDFYELYQTDVLSEGTANRMLQKVDQYQKQVSEFLTDVGSYQNRLQHAMEYAMEHAEIETDAESRIRDADYGKEAVEHAKQNLQQQIQETLFAEKNRTKEQIKQVLSRV